VKKKKSIFSLIAFKINSFEKLVACFVADIKNNFNAL
jgi:hypothetical protein